MMFDVAFMALPEDIRLDGYAEVRTEPAPAGDLTKATHVVQVLIGVYIVADAYTNDNDPADEQMLLDLVRARRSV